MKLEDDTKEILGLTGIGLIGVAAIMLICWAAAMGCVAMGYGPEVCGL